MKLCTICARGGSKGVKGKNLRKLLGRELIAYSLEQARRSELFAEIAVSSDSPEILESAKREGPTVLIERPAELASDTAGKLPAIRHAALEAEKRSGKRFDTIVDLDVTSPLRLVEDIRGACDQLERERAGVVITGAPARRSPYFNLVEIDAEGRVGLSKRPSQPFLRRQDAPRCYDMNASIYVFTREALIAREGLFHEDTKLFEMPEERSLDIDSELDFELVEAIARLHGRFQENAW